MPYSTNEYHDCLDTMKISEGKRFEIDLVIKSPRVPYLEKYEGKVAKLEAIMWESYADEEYEYPLICYSYFINKEEIDGGFVRPTDIFKDEIGDFEYDLLFYQCIEEVQKWAISINPF